jgi:hypothetical protein
MLIIERSKVFESWKSSDQRLHFLSGQLLDQLLESLGAGSTPDAKQVSTTARDRDQCHAPVSRILSALDEPRPLQRSHDRSHGRLGHPFDYGQIRQPPRASPVQCRHCRQ